MKVISIGMGQIIFEKDSAVRSRQIQYGKLFDELHLIVFSSSDKKFSVEKLNEKVFIYPTNTALRIFYIFDFFRIAKNIIKNSKDKNFIITTQDPFETGLVGLLLKLFFGLPLHIQLHTDFANKYFLRHSPLNIIRFLLAHIILPYADSVRAVSQKVAKSVQDLNSEVSVLPISQKFEILDLELNKKFNGRLLTVCRLEKEKDIETALKAFKELTHDHREATFTIVGDGSQRKSLELLANSLGVEDRIKFVGWQNDLNSFYKEADIYISTSLFEGYGVSVVEAALSGLPLVLSNAGIAFEYFNNNGALISDPQDLNGFVISLKALFSDSELRSRMGKLAKNSAQSRMIEWSKYLELYRIDILRVMNKKINRSVIFRFVDLFRSVTNNNRFLRFIIAGGFVAVSQIGILYLLTEFAHLYYLLSSTISFIYAVVSSFFLQKYWAFKDQSRSRAWIQFAMFVGVAIIGIIINTFSMYFWVEWVGLWYVLSQFITGFMIAVINFLIYKFLIFRK